MELDPLLANFILSKRKKDGSEYEPSSLRGIIGSIDRKLKRMKYGFSILGEGSKANDVFNLTRESLKAKQKVLKQQGKGNKPKRAQPITDEEINMLYKKELLGNANHEALVNTLWLNNTIHFGLRGANEHYSLRWGDVTLVTGSDGIKYLEMNERQTKTRTGENVSDIRDVTPRMYQSFGDNDPVALYEFYKSKRPVTYCGQDDPFYLAPRTIPMEDNRSWIWFIRQKIGERKLASLMKTMKERAGFNQDKRLTNHSARKYLVNKLRENDIEAKDIMQISGHKNAASVNNYSAMPENKHRDISRILSNTNRGTLAIPEKENLPFNFRGNTLLSHSQMPPNNLPPSVPTPYSLGLPSSQICSQSQSNHRVTSMFYCASLNVGTLNVYMNPPNE